MHDGGNADAFFARMVADGAPAVATADSGEVFAQRLKQVELEHAALQAVRSELRQDEQRFQGLIQAERTKLETFTKQLAAVEVRRSKLADELEKCNAKAADLERQKAAAAEVIARLQVEALATRDEKLRAASTSFSSRSPSAVPGVGTNRPCGPSACRQHQEGRMDDAPGVGGIQAGASGSAGRQTAKPVSGVVEGDLLGDVGAGSGADDVAPTAAATSDLLTDDPLAMTLRGAAAVSNTAACVAARCAQDSDPSSLNPFDAPAGAQGGRGASGCGASEPIIGVPFNPFDEGAARHVIKATQQQTSAHVASMDAVLQVNLNANQQAAIGQLPSSLPPSAEDAFFRVPPAAMVSAGRTDGHAPSPANAPTANIARGSHGGNSVGCAAGMPMRAEAMWAGGGPSCVSGVPAPGGMGYSYGAGAMGDGMTAGVCGGLGGGLVIRELGGAGGGAAISSPSGVGQAGVAPKRQPISLDGGTGKRVIDPFADLLSL